MFLISDTPPIDFRFSFEIRERFEQRLNRDFLESNSDDRDDLFFRFRPGFELKSGKHWSAVVQFQYAHNKAWKPGPDTVLENRDARDAYLRYTGPGGTWTGGRQKVVVGSERLIGSAEWLNVGRSFDGLRVQSQEWDVFAGKVGVFVPRPRNAEIAFAARQWRAGQTALIVKKDEGASGNQEIWTLSHAQKSARGVVDTDYEVAIQGGESAGLDHEAWAAHGTIGYRPDKANRYYVELNAASGGAGTSKSETFDNLYPSNHKFYGSMDLQGWRNMQELSLGWQRKLTAKADLQVHGHWFRLMDAKDAWYGAGGAPNRRVGGVYRDSTGAAGKDVGFELDLEGTIRLDSRTNLQLGVGIFEPGKFVDRMNGGTSDRQKWFYLQVMRRL